MRYCTERFRAEENGRVLWFVRRLIKWQFLLLRQKALLRKDGHEGWRKRCTERIYGMMQNFGVRLHQQLYYEMPTVDLFRARVWQPSVATHCPRASSYHRKTASHMLPLVTHGSLCTRELEPKKSSDAHKKFFPKTSFHVVGLRVIILSWWDLTR